MGSMDADPKLLCSLGYKDSCTGFQVFLLVIVLKVLQKDWELMLACRDLSHSKLRLPSICLNLQTVKLLVPQHSL